MYRYVHINSYVIRMTATQFALFTGRRTDTWEMASASPCAANACVVECRSLLWNFGYFLWLESILHWIYLCTHIRLHLYMLTYMRYCIYVYIYMYIYSHVIADVDMVSVEVDIVLSVDLM